MEANADFKASVISTIKKDYGKLLNPMREEFAYTMEDLINYLNWATKLLDDVKVKIEQLNIRAQRKVG